MSRSKAVTKDKKKAASDDNKAVVIAIYNLYRDDKLLKKQINHINVSFKKGVVTLSGWVFPPKGSDDPNEGVKLAVKLARQVNKKVKNTLVEEKPIQCPPGMVPCGPQGVCIPEDAQCNLPPPRG
jgi:hypothetical protein